MLNERLKTALLATVVCAGGAACDRPGADGGGVVADSAGVTIVRNPAQPIEPTAPLRVEEVLRVGSALGGDGTQFGLIASIAVDDDGRMFVLDRPSSRVIEIAPDGRVVRTFGGAGAGPGEISGQAVNVFVTAADSLLVADPGNLRINVYAPDGSPAGSLPVPSPTGTIPFRFGLLPDGRIVQHVRTVPTPERPELRDDLFVTLGRNGDIVDTLHRMPTGRSIRFRDGVAQFAAYEPEPVWALDADGRFFSAMSGQYRIEVRNGQGELVRVIEREHSREPITAADRDAFLRMIRRQMAEQRVDPAMIDQIVNGMSFAERYPAFAHFLPGPRSTLWVQHVRSARELGEAFDAAQIGSDRWDVFDADGRFIAQARLPERFVPLTSRDDRFYGFWSDDLDVQHVMVVRVNGLPRQASAANGSNAT